MMGRWHRGPGDVKPHRQAMGAAPPSQEDTRRELACGRECLLTFRLMPYGLAREVTGEAVRPVVLHAQAPALAHGGRPRGPFPARAPVHERALAPGPGGVRPGRCRPGEAAVRGAA